MKNEDIESLVKDYFGITKEVNPRITTLISLLNYDLYMGPIDSDQVPEGFEWKGFTSGAREVSKFLEDKVHEVWIDTDSESISDSEPEGEEIDGEWCEPYWENWMHLEYSDVKRYILGKELANTI